MTATERSDEVGRLLGRVALRDQAAFKQLYDATVRCLLAIAVRLLRDPAWAEEVIQEAYVSIWHSAPGYSAGKAAPMTWLMAIARNKALDALRSRTSEREVIVHRTVDIDVDEDPVDLVADQAAGPLQRLIDHVDGARVRHCLERLEAAQRQAIALAFYDGLTHSELAEHMRQPLGTVKAWVRRGLERLRPCLQS